MQNQEVLISMIMNTPPYQLPPVVKQSGTFQLDVVYKASPLHVTGESLHFVLDRYLRHVIAVNDRSTDRVADANGINAPVAMGSTIPARYERRGE